MKTRLIVLSLLTVIAVATASTLGSYHLGYRRGYGEGYRQGGDAESACWTLDPAPSALGK